MLVVVRSFEGHVQFELLALGGTSDSTHNLNDSDSPVNAEEAPNE